ncbi:RapZ C-terminal domain-containing protein [Kitasatospora cineracea]
MQITITSFGYGHADPPAAHITLDLRWHFRDPHIDPALRHLTAEDQPVRNAVLTTGGITELIDVTAQLATCYEMGPGSDDHGLTIAVGCAGGRHRAPTVADALAAVLSLEDYDVAVLHRDLHRDVIDR